MLSFLALLFFVSAALFVVIGLTRKNIRSGKTDLALGALFGPLILIIQYGVLAIPPAAQAAFLNGGIWGVSTVYYLVAFLIILVSVIFYYIGFLGALGPSIFHKPHEKSTQAQDRMLLGLFIAVLFLDIVARIDQMQSGTYFTWMRSKALEEGEDIGTLAMLGSNLYPIIVVLSVYFSRRSKFAYAYIFGIIFLVFLEGNRTNLLLCFVALYFSLWQTGGISRRILRTEFIILVPLLYFLMQVIIQSRVILRFDTSAFLASPIEFFLNVFPQALMISLGLQDGDIYSRISLANASITERTAAWAYCFAFQIKQLFNGYDLLPIRNAALEISRSVPSVLWPGEKPLVSSGETLARHFDMPIRGDPATTVITSAYLHFGIFVLPIFCYFVGFSYRMVLAFCRRVYGAGGRVLFPGFISFFLLTGNSFSSYFASIRNLVIILLIGYVVGLFTNCTIPRRFSK